jgi:hypothetical protein
MLKFFTSQDEKFIKSGNAGPRASSVGAIAPQTSGISKKLKISSKLVENLQNKENFASQNGFHIKKRSQEEFQSLQKSRDRYSSNKKANEGPINKVTPYKEYKDSSSNRETP